MTDYINDPSTTSFIPSQSTWTGKIVTKLEDVKSGYSSGNGVISGTVTELTVPVQNRVVNIYEIRSGILLQSTISAANGTFSFSGLDKNNKYYVLAVEKDGGPSYNAVIFDKIVPG